MTIHLFIQPSDVWLFRDGKPFDVGTDNRARSLFPPNPSTIQGALRSAELVRRGVSFADYGKGLNGCADTKTRRAGDAIGWPGGGYGKLRLSGPFVARARDGSVTRLFPLPADLYRVGGNYRTPTVLQNSPFVNNAPAGLLPLWIGSGARIEKPQGNWLTEDGLRKYLKGEYSDLGLIQSQDLFERESRFGVSIESRYKRAREGYLFQIEFVRPRTGVGLSVVAEGLDDWPQQGTLALGGDARVATYRRQPPPVKLPAAVPGPRFKLYFATSAYFASGWQPADWNAYFDGKVKLVAAAVRRPTLIGGWDLKEMRSKPLRRYVPAGSVFYFKAQGQVTFKGIPVTQDGAEIGYGHVCISEKEWNNV